MNPKPISQNFSSTAFCIKEIAPICQELYFLMKEKELFLLTYFLVDSIPGVRYDFATSYKELIVSIDTPHHDDGRNGG
jgi:hypothetical protein